MKRVLFFMLLAGLLTGGLNRVAAQNTPQYIFKFATEDLQGSILHKALTEIGKEIYYTTNKQVALRIYAGGVMGDQATMLKLVQLGQISGGIFAQLGLSIIYKDAGILDFPLLFENYEEYDYVMGQMRPYLENQIERNGYVVLGWTEAGFQYIYSKNPANTPDSLRLARLFMHEGDRVRPIFFTEQMIFPVSLRYPDILTSLQTGQIDTVLASPYELVTMHWESQINYATNFPLFFRMQAVVIKKSDFDTLPPQYRQIVKDIFASKITFVTAAVREKNQQTIDLLRKKGIIQVSIDHHTMEQFMESAQRTVNLVMRSEGYSAEVFSMIMNYRNQYRSMHR